MTYSWYIEIESKCQWQIALHLEPRFVTYAVTESALPEFYLVATRFANTAYKDWFEPPHKTMR